MVYEYKCEICGNIDSLEMSMNEDHPEGIKCSKCGKESRRQFQVNTIFPFWLRPEENRFDYTKK